MRISYKTDYALKAILHLSGNYPNKIDHIKDISQKQDIPKKFLEQVLLLLKNGGFVLSKKGPNGGYFLKKAPDQITIGDIIRHIDDSVSPISCIETGNGETCDFSSICVFRQVFNDVEKAISDIIDNIDFKELLIKEKKLKENRTLNFEI